MRQYNRIKAKYPDALLLFRVGDFYETFGEDAIKASQILGIVLTKRSNGAAAMVDLAGFPYHALDNYLPKLVKAGYRVAICDQLEDPKLAKTIVKRGITELVTPGVSTDDRILDQKENNFLASIQLGENLSGISFLDISTGEFLVAQGNNEYIDKLLQNFKPSEIILQKNKLHRFIEIFGDKYYINTFDDWVFTEDFARETLLRHFQVVSLKGFGIEIFPLAIIAAGAAMHYLAETQHDRLSHITRIARIEEEKYVWLDRFTIRNLEIVQTFNENARSLLQILDQTISPMGARLLRRWITMPIKERKVLEERLDLVELLISDHELAEFLATHLKTVGDLERLISKVSIGKANPREVLYIARGLEAIERIASRCLLTHHPVLMQLCEQLNPCKLIRDRIFKTLKEDCPPVLIKGNIIAERVDEELDHLREILYQGKDVLAKIQQREIQTTGISSLKIGFNNIFGYLINSVFTAHQRFQPSPFGFIFLFIGQILLFEFFVQFIYQGFALFTQIDFCQPALVINTNRCPIFHSLSYIVNIHIIPKNSRRVYIGIFNRRTRKTQIRCIGQRITQIFGKAIYDFFTNDLIPFVPFVDRFGFKSVLAPVSFIGNDHNVFALGKQFVNSLSP